MPSYAYDWWRQDPGRILDIDMLEECLDCYQQYIPFPVTSSMPTNSQPAPKAPDGQAICQPCVNLRALIHQMFDEACTIQDFLNGCESSADAALNANIRKAAGFHALHEHALLKELHAEP